MARGVFDETAETSENDEVVELRFMRWAWTDTRIITALLVLAIVPRTILSTLQFYHHFDEIWQYVEPAYGLSQGKWVITWEYRAGMRGWLLPLLLAGPLSIARLITGDTIIAISCVRIMLSIAALSIVWSGFVIGRQVSRLHAIVTGLVLATSFDLIFFAGRPLSEVVATSALVPGAVLIVSRPRTIITAASAGALLGIAVCLRFQLAPCVAVVAMAGFGRDLRAWRWGLAGGLFACAVTAMADASQGLVPFRWIIENFRLNLIERRSENYGVEPVSWYITTLWEMWWLAALPFAVAILIGTRRAPVLVAAALVNIAFHSLIPHKELRFIFPSIALLVLVAGLGTADVINLLRQGNSKHHKLGLIAAVLAWIGLSATAIATPVGRSRWHGRQQLMIWREIHGMPTLCGLGTIKQPTGVSYAFIDRPVESYAFQTLDGALVNQRDLAFNVLIASKSDEPRLTNGGWQLSRCFANKDEIATGAPPNQCLYRRGGGCKLGKPWFRENAVRARLGI